ncbi:hypothetical protein T484DRAFT_2541460 [Baffinella frigidus]|nr:hypothetical protein T484DRAFT_2541460 [Cryptophyta sp. CCMP2293]
MSQAKTDIDEGSSMSDFVDWENAEERKVLKDIEAKHEASEECPCEECLPPAPTEEEREGTREWLAKFKREEDAKGMGGKLWRACLYESFIANKTEEYREKLEYTPVEGWDPDASFLPPPKGIGDNRNATRDLQEELLVEMREATISGNISMIESVLAAGGEINLRDYLLEEEGCTPLLYTIVYNHTEAALALIAMGADPNKADRLLCTPLHYCAEVCVCVCERERERERARERESESESEREREREREREKRERERDR